MEGYIPLLLAVSGILAGLAMGYGLFKNSQKGAAKKAQAQAELIVKEAQMEAESLKKDKLLEAKEKFYQLKEQLEKELTERKETLDRQAQKQQQRESQLGKEREALSRQKGELDDQRADLEAQLATLRKRREEVDRLKSQQTAKLENMANLSAEQALEELKANLLDEARSQASSKVRELVEEANQTATKEAKRIVISTIQRTATESAMENCVSVFNLESDDVKGKIIGREGRNIRALEASTGVEIIVDDTPEAIIISGFDPVRREVARLSLHRLVTDGRIHPARIEEVVAKTTKNIDEEIREIGERTVIDLGIHGLHPELVKMVGRMRYRSSYGQNLLQHSREVANLCATMASELGLNVKLAKRAGLLHDLGKVWPEEPELPHALLGMQLAEKHKENKEVCNAIGAHHDEIEMTSLISPIVQACDAISGSRPGARREVLDSYIKRLKDLENLAMDFDGVTKCFAIQAGRELRVMVDAERVADDVAGQLSFDISQKIEREMQYPGQIKVTVIREMRSVAFAK